MSADFQFAWPAVFLLLPLPWLARRWLPPVPPRHLLRLPALGHFPALMQADNAGHGRTPWLAWLLWGLLLIAAARPQVPALDAPLPVSGRSLMLAFDLSASMATRDMALDGQPLARLDAARQLARGFIARRSGDRVGLIVFGKQAYVHVPPSFDLTAVEAALDSVTVGLAGNETALGDAIALATKQLRAQPDPARVLVLLTDGANTAGTLAPQRAAWLAEREGVRIHAVGLGATTNQSPAFDLDAESLQALTAQTGGRYQPAGDAAALADFFRNLDALEPLPDTDAALRPVRELFAGPLAAALLLAGLLVWRQRRVASPTGISFGHADFPAQAVDAHLLPHLRVERSTDTLARLLWPALLLLGLLALLTAWLQPAESGTRFRTAALHVLVADLSGPQTDGLLRTRLTELLERLPPGETALIVYAGDAYLAVPPTSDPRNITALVPELGSDILPVPGNRPERALQQAQDLVVRSPGMRSHILWLTANPAQIPEHEDRRVIDISAATASADIAALATQLAGAGRWQLEGRAWPAGNALLSALLLLALLPMAALGFRRGLLLAVLPAPTFALLILSFTPGEVRADEAGWQAVAHYRAGRYDAALRLLAGRDDAVAHYNRGNALARLGHYAEAEMAYAASLARRPDDVDAQFNLELMRRLRNPPPPPSSGSKPPPTAAPPSQAEAARVAAQWLKGVPDDPGGLLRAKLRLEHARRMGTAP